MQVGLKGLNVKAKKSEAGEDFLEKVVDNAEEVIIESNVFKVNQMLFAIMTCLFHHDSHHKVYWEHLRCGY